MKLSRGEKIFEVVNYFVLTILGLCFLVPFLFVLADSRTKHTERAGRVVEALGRLSRGEILDEIGTKGFVLAVQRFLRAEEELSLGPVWDYRISSTVMHMFTIVFCNSDVKVLWRHSPQILHIVPDCGQDDTILLTCGNSVESSN